jgi:hypothetical protein
VLRDERWEALAIGSLAFVDNVKRELGVEAMRREIAEVAGT